MAIVINRTPLSTVAEMAFLGGGAQQAAQQQAQLAQSRIAAAQFEAQRNIQESQQRFNMLQNAFSDVNQAFAREEQKRQFNENVRLREDKLTFDTQQAEDAKIRRAKNDKVANAYTEALTTDATERAETAIAKRRAIEAKVEADRARISQTQEVIQNDPNLSESEKKLLAAKASTGADVASDFRLMTKPDAPARSQGVLPRPVSAAVMEDTAQFATAYTQDVFNNKTTFRKKPTDDVEFDLQELWRNQIDRAQVEFLSESNLDALRTQTIAGINAAMASDPGQYKNFREKIKGPREMESIMREYEQSERAQAQMSRVGALLRKPPEREFEELAPGAGLLDKMVQGLGMDLASNDIWGQ